MKSKVHVAEFLLFIVTIIWGLGFPITKIAIEYGFGPNTIMVGRFLVATIILGIVYFKKIIKMNKTVIKYGVITGVFLFSGFYFQTLGNVYTSASRNGFITQLNIIFVPFLYFIFFRKRVTFINVVSVILAILGMFILTYSNDTMIGLNIGDFYTFICAIMIALHITTASYFQKKQDFDPAVFVFVNIATSLVLSLLFMLIFEKAPTMGIGLYWPLLFLGVLNTALGFLVQSYALKVSLPTRVSLIVTLESVFGAIGAVVILGEKVTWQLVVGGIMFVGAVILLEFITSKKMNKNPNILLE